MPDTDLLALCSAEVRREFNDLFSFAVSQGIAPATSRGHYARRFAADAFGVRREFDQLLAGKQFEKVGTEAVHVDVREIPGYPSVSPSDETAYPESWV